ncbi:MAG: EVE domain-containing protein [Coleofasciculus sp. S288]|nr:EVE domain-containing protein [Coleofasciculus sp. S288]
MASTVPRECVKILKSYSFRNQLLSLFLIPTPNLIVGVQSKIQNPKSKIQNRMAYWLLKSEPQEYSWDDLKQAKRTVWDGVKNPLALKYLRAMQPDDEAFFYHTGKERRIVGVAQILTLPYPDPAVNDPKRVVVNIRSVRSLPQPVTLEQIKQDENNFPGFDLIRLPRLSVIPVSTEYWQQILHLAEGGVPLTPDS